MSLANSTAKTDLTIQQSGFTLLELLVAMVIFAIMSIMAYGGLSNVIDNSDASTKSLNRLQDVQRSITILNRDLTQIRPRDIRDQYGENKPFLITDSSTDNMVEFSRGGRPNPANIKRSSLLRVAYRLEDNSLVRLQWSFLDAAPATEPNTTVLLDDVENVAIRFLDDTNEWSDIWPSLNSAAQLTTADNPQKAKSMGGLRAIEVKITLNDWGEIRRLYAIQ